MVKGQRPAGHGLGKEWLMAWSGSEDERRKLLPKWEKQKNVFLYRGLAVDLRHVRLEGCLGIYVFDSDITYSLLFFKASIPNTSSLCIRHLISSPSPPCPHPYPHSPTTSPPPPSRYFHPTLSHQPTNPPTPSPSPSSPHSTPPPPSSPHKSF
jgi:hypothetical protein